MGLDYDFVSALLPLSPREIDALSVGETFLLDDGAKRAIGFIRTYIHETGKTPPPTLVVERFPEIDPEHKTDAQWYVGQLRERKLFNVAKGGIQTMTQDLQHGSVQDVLETLERVQRDLLAINENINVHDIQALGENLKQFYLDIKAGKRGIEMPWEALNLLTRGLWPETVTFFAARPGVGKTFLAIIIARHAHLLGKRVLIISPEMNALEIGERFFAIEAGVPYSDVVSGSLSEVKESGGQSAEERYFEVLASKIGRGPGPWIVDDEERLTGPALESIIAATEPDLLGIDAAYLLRIGKGTRYERIIENVEWMRYVSKKYHLPVVATSQLTKEAEKKGVVGQLTTALTDTINWDAHNLFGLKQSPEMRDDGKLDIIPIKVRRAAKRHGKSEVHIHWDMDAMMFDEIEEESGGEFKDKGFQDEDMPF